MKFIRLVTTFVLTFGLTACGHRDYILGGRTFHSYEEARAYNRTTYDQWLAEVQPLPAPIAGPAIVISPTRAQWEDDLRGDYPDMNDQEIRNMVELLVGDRFPIRIIERRNIFQNIRHIESQSPEGTQAPPGGYLLWFELRSVGTHSGTDLHIVASGETERTKIFDGSRPVDPKESRSRVLQAIEEYVKAHPAAG